MFSFGDFSARELAELDLSIQYRRRKPTVVTVEPTYGKFAWAWEKVQSRKDQRAAAQMRPKLTKREQLRKTLLKQYAGRPLEFGWKYARFLGENKFKNVAPFYKEIYDILYSEAMKVAKAKKPKQSKGKIKFPTNRFEVIAPEDAGVEGEFRPYEDFGDLEDPAPPRRPKVRKPDMSNITGSYAPQRRQALGDIRLKFRLRMMIRAMEARRAKKPYVDGLIGKIMKRIPQCGFPPIVDNPGPGQLQRYTRGWPEMEDQQGEELIHDKSGNVTLTESNPASSMMAAKPSVTLKWHDTCSSELATDYTYLTNRWLLVKQSVWSTTSIENTELSDFKLNLPLDIRNIGTAGCVPLRAPFDIFTYYKTDVELKIHVNSNKFQMGQLQFSFQYCEPFRPANSFDNIWLRSQLPNVVINAGASNEATLYIPFKHVTPYLSTQHGSLGMLRCFVISRLDSGDNCPKTCGITVFARFPNCQFVGMRDGSIKPEMEAAAAGMVASAVIDKVIGDRNCDNPVDGSNPQYVVPTASHTWSLSSGLAAKLHNLRLMNPSAQVGRPAGIDMSETSIGVPCRTFGMLQHIKWDATSDDTNKYGYELWRCNAHPQLSKSKFFKVSVEKALDKYSVPPITVVSGLYKQWRGSLEFKFDIVSTQFHTGRILVAYIPGATDSTKVTLEQARNSPCAEFSLQDSSSFTFVVPFISMMPWWPRKYAGPLDVGGNKAPSMIVMFVLNPLVYMDSVPKYVNFIPYVRGGVDFEVSVPVQPANSLGHFNASTIADQDKIYPDSKSIPFRVTSSQKFFDSKVYVCYEGSDTLGTVAGWHASATPMNKGPDGKATQTYYCKPENLKHMPVVKWKVTNPTTRKTQVEVHEVGFLSLWWSEADKYWYGVPFPNTQEGEARSKVVSAGLLLGKSREKIGRYLYSPVEDSNWSSSNLDDIKFTPHIIEKSEAEQLWSNDKVTGDPEMEERYGTLNLLNPVPSLVSTGCGSFTFNENFSDLKDLCRRYQLYLDKNIYLDKTFNTGEGIAVIPIIPSGLAPDVTDPESAWNYIRSGHIPMIANGYVFFRGSVRLRIVVSSDDSCFDGSSIWIQHHPDACTENISPVYYPSLQTDDKLRCHGYGFYVQNLNINRIVELEVPFYQTGMYGILNDISESAMKAKTILNYASLGNIVVGLCTPCVNKQKAVNLQIYYSIGDDMSFSTFRGFDAVTFTDEVWKPDSVDIDDSISDYEVVPRGDPEMEDAQPEMWSAICGGVVNTIVSLGASAVTNATASVLTKDIKRDIGKAIGETLAARLDGPLKDTLLEVKKTRADLTQSIQEGFKDTVLTGMLCELAHIAASPTLRTVAVSFASILIQILHLTVNQLTIFSETCSKFFAASWDKFSSVVLPDAPEAGNPESEFEFDECEKSLVALVFTSICALFGCSSLTAPKGCGDLLRGINSGVCLFNNFVRLLENCGKLISKFIKYVNSKLHPEAHLEGLLEEGCPEVKNWVQEVQFLLDARNKERFIYDRLMLARVFDAATFGALLVSNGLDERKPGGKVLWDLFKEIRKLRNDLCERGAHPDVRFETFPLWITGPPGIGKSFMVTELSNHLLRSVNHRSPGSMIYYIQPGAKYWSGVTNPAVLVSDDMFQVGGTRLEEELANVFMICSSSVLNPPMAAVEDKERRLNPLMYIMLSNESFPNLGSVARTAPALYRRRKFLIETRLKAHILRDYPGILDASDLPRECTQNFAHLEFRVAKDPKNTQTPWLDWMEYDDLLKLITPRFQQHYEHERANFRQRMIHMYNLDPNFNEMNLVNEIPLLRNVASLKEQMELVRARVARQLDDLNDPRREPDKDVWYYIRQFKDYVSNLYATPEMPLPYANSEANAVPPHISESDIASENGYRTRVNPNIDLRAMLEGRIAVLRPQHHEQVAPYYATYLEYFSDLHREYMAGMQNLPDFLRRDFIDLHSEYPNCELLGVDVLLSASARDKIDTLFTRAFIQRLALGGDATTEIIINDISAFNLTTFEQLQFLIHEGDPKAREYLIAFLITGELVDPFPDEGKGVFHMMPNDKFVMSNVMSYPKLKVSCNKLLCTGMEELEYVLHRQVMTQDLQKHIGKYLALRFAALPGAIVESLVNAKTYEQLYQICRNIYLLPARWNSVLDPKYVAYVIASIVLTFECIISPHACDIGACYSSDALDYCHIRNTLTTGAGTRVVPCTRVGCKFKNEFYYLLACWHANSHAYLHLSDDEPYNGHYRFYFSHSMDNLLRLRREKRTTEAVDSFTSYCKDFFCHTLPTVAWRVFVFFLEWWPLILGGLYFTYSMYKTFYLGDTKFFAEGSVPEANYFKFNQPKFPSKPKVPTGPRSFSVPSPEMSTEQRQTMVNRINKNAVIIYVNWVQDNERMTRNCRCLMLGGKNMLVLRHYLEEYEALVNAGYKLNIDCVYGNKLGDPVKVNITYEELVREVAYCDNSNFCIVVLPKYFKLFPKIYPFFATRAQHDNVSGSVDMITIAGNSSFDMPVKVQRNFVLNATENSSEVCCERVYSYMKRSPGLCGSVIVSPALGSGGGAIIGMHIAGSASSGKGFAEPLYQEMFSEFFQTLPSRDILEPIVAPLEEADIELDGNMFMYGCVPREMAHKESGRTNIVPSLLYNTIYPPVTEVNPLKPNDPRQPPGSHPLRDGCNKHGSGNVRNFALRDVELVKEDMIDRLNQIVKPIRAEIKPLTLQQAICGDPDIPHFESLNWKSSEGFPLSAHRPSWAHDKKWLFDLEEGKFGYNLKGLHSKLEMQLKFRNECFKKNVKPPTVYVDCLKDYRLRPEKCAKPGSTRIFSVAPIQCSIDVRMHLTDFTASLKQTHIYNSIGIGINPDSIEWTNLVNYLFEVGPCIITLDYSNFGPCLMSQLVAAGNDCIVEWHRLNGASPEHVERVDWLLECDILNPVHLCSNVLYQTVNGIASGSPLTGECNSIPNLFYIRCAYLEIMRERHAEYANMYYFNLFVRIVVYGDDLIMSVSPDIIDYFNALTIQATLDMHGIKVTSARKNEELKPFDKIENSTFLKRTFKRHPHRPGIWLAPVEEDSVQECINWMHRCDDPEAATLEVVQASLDLAYGHGPEYYNKHRQRLVNACKEINLVITSKTWYERDNEIFGESVQEVKSFSSKLTWDHFLNKVDLTSSSD